MKQAEGAAKKITIQVWRPVWSRLEKKIKSSFLRRDAFIERLVLAELDRLDIEMSIPNSMEAKMAIEQQLRALHDFTPLSVTFSPTTIEKLDKVLGRKRVVRDSFFNRIFFFLAYGPKLAGILLFGCSGEKPTAWATELWAECKHDGPFFENVFEPFMALADPLWPIHRYFELIEEQQRPKYIEWMHPDSRIKVDMAKVSSDLEIYELPFRFHTAVLTDRQLRRTKGAEAPKKPKTANSATLTNEFYNLLGLNCYLPNYRVSGHKEQKEFEKHIDDMLENL